MDLFSTLPVELLEIIVQESSPFSLEPLTLTCRTLAALARPALAEARRARSHFDRRLKVDCCPAPSQRDHDALHPVQILEKLILNPVAGWYVEEVTCRLCSLLPHSNQRNFGHDEFDFRDRCDAYQSQTVDGRTPLVGAMKQFEALIEQTGVARFTEKSPSDYLKSIFKGRDFAELALLLQCLPNIRLLRVSGWERVGMPEALGSVLDHMDLQPSHGSLLSRLKILELISPAYRGFGHYDALRNAEDFLLLPSLLPSVKVLRAHQVDGFKLNTLKPYKDSHSSLDTLQILDGDFEGKCVDALLRPIQHLKHFQYSLHDHYGEVDVMLPLAPLVRFAANSLTWLSLTMISGNTWYKSRDLSSAPPLKSFTALRCLEIDAYFFTKPGQVHRYNEKPWEDCSEEEVYPLVDHLPVALESLILHTTDLVRRPYKKDERPVLFSTGVDVDPDKKAVMRRLRLLLAGMEIDARAGSKRLSSLPKLQSIDLIQHWSALPLEWAQGKRPEFMERCGVRPLGSDLGGIGNNDDEMWLSEGNDWVINDLASMDWPDPPRYSGW